MSDKEMRRKVALAWEMYAVRELGMSAGRAISQFNDWTDRLTQANQEVGHAS